MKGKRFTEEQITYALRQVEGGTPVVDVCRQLGVSEASFYLWKKKYGKLGMTEIREMRQLRDECLNVMQFESIEDAIEKIEAWRIDYNDRRPHSSLGHLTPNEYAQKGQEKRTSELAVL
jgi:putative transposase